jgi:hypothetical protein
MFVSFDVFAAVVGNCSSAAAIGDHMISRSFHSSSVNNVKQLLDLDALCVVDADMTSSLSDDVVEFQEDSSSQIDTIPLSVQRSIGIPADNNFCNVSSHVTSRSPAIGVSCIVTSRKQFG